MNKLRLQDQLLPAVLFALAGLALLAWFVNFAEPRHRTHRAPFQENYSEQRLLEQLTPANLAGRIAQIAGAGTQPGEKQIGRATGSPGFYRTENLITEAFQAGQLQIQKQELEVVVPVTEVCEILGADGQPLPGVQLYPFEPGGLVPTVLPAEGIKARLVATENLDLALLAGNNPQDTIVLTYLDAATATPGLWLTPAKAGVRALIVREDDAAKALRADPDAPAAWGNLFTGTETYFPRFVARGPIEKFAGQTVTVRCKVTWQTKTVHNVLGVLPGKGSSREALAVTAFYDSSSVVPELAPGAEQSLSLVALLEFVRALAPYRGQLDRDVVFVATAGHAQGMSGVARLLEAIRSQTLAQERDAHARQTSGPIPADVYKAAAGEINLDRRNELLTAKLAYLRAGKPIYREGFDHAHATDAERALPANTHPLLAAYIAAQTRDNLAANLVGLPVEELKRRPEFKEWDYAGRAEKLWADRCAYHAAQVRQLDDSLAVQKIFAAYDRTLTLNLDLYSGGRTAGKTLGLAVGTINPGTVVEPQISDLAYTVLNKGATFPVLHWGSRDVQGLKDNPCSYSRDLTQLESALWFRCGRLAFSAINNDFFPAKMWTPEDTWDGLRTGVLEQQLPVLGKTILAVAAGQVAFKTVPADARNLYSVHGTVLGSAGAASVVPSHRMTTRTFVQVFSPTWITNDRNSTHGIQQYPVLPVNPHGEFLREFVSDLSAWSGAPSAAAVRFDEAGNVEYINDTSPSSQSLFKTQELIVKNLAALGATPPKPISFSMFRCAPVTLYDSINPQTMKSFKGLAVLDNLGFSTPPRYHYTGLETGEKFSATSPRSVTAFLEPDVRFYLGLLDGAADNKELLTDRAFMLNADWRQPIGATEPEVFGRSYLAADTPAIPNLSFDGASSMLRTSEKRLDLQKKFGMADAQMLGFQKQGQDWLADAHEQLASNNVATALNSAETSFAYAINNHPVIRSRIAQAVVGILWYLGLLVPFVFFAEKLVCGFTDIRKQLVASGVIFLVVFGLLRWFHPAFQMVRSSLMILLGFVILLLTFLVTLMVGGKFKQNLKDLRRNEGRVEGADISRGGVVGTAFMLGLNNMRRRKVRTGLTCATLVLITFVMICFTSVSTDLVNIEQPVSRSNWSGLMIRDPNFKSLEAARVGNLRQIYGSRYPVTVHEWLVASPAGDSLQNSDIVIDRELTSGGASVVKRGHVSAAVKMDWREPQFTGLDRYLLTKKGWFPRPPETRQEKLAARDAGYKDRKLVILPDNVAADLGIRPEDVDQGAPVIKIRGADFEVQGIIDAGELAKVQGLDGQSILPYDLNTVQSIGKDSAGTAMLPTDTGRLPALQVILVNALPPQKGGSDISVTAACMVLFPKNSYRIKSDGPEFPAPDYRAQRRLVLGYLERIGQPAYYAIDGIAYYGSRQRATSFAGLLELLVPILIAALTVFNTMRGSVYERKSEIYVYNAVGIAPNHVFFMFMAEACVYAVIGAVAGYILSQGTGRLLTAIHFTGGMNMDYSSIETIYASLAIMAAVLLSTLIPARDAAKLAAPSDIVSWTLPKADGDVMTFMLPFTFTPHDRVAVVSYFYRWLDSNGAGSSGPFFCSPPAALLAGDKELVPAVASTVWLKPYDLGVSQRMEISLPTDPETGEFIAQIKLTRLSGHVAGWQRTLRPFLSVLRKQFLNWRATTDAERREMFAEASRILNEVTHA